MRWNYLISVLLIFVIFYFSASFFGFQRAVFLEPSEVDRAIPFLAWTVWIYSLTYVMLPLTFLLLRSQNHLRNFTYAVATSIILSSAVFFWYPTLITRSHMNGHGVSKGVLKFLHWVDLPTNCFPSLHVAIMILIAFYLHKESKAWGWFTWILTLLVSISTMTTKQHYFVDVLGGAAVAALSIVIVAKLTKRFSREADAVS
ncbi:MAG: phosphatase PAP2 family protein [Deltaproteobacteria bacterium]|nr:phosphatase PAP2 family protein [Deltaproteobacteria bacterium]